MTAASTAGPTAAPDREVLYVADPCCSWCWGFSPIINELRSEFESEVQFTLRLGGLRVGDHHVRDADRKAYLAETWARVGAFSGQPFDLAGLERDDVSENTEPACRATIVMRSLEPDRTFAYFHRLQHAFFAEGRDLSKPDVLRELAVEKGADGRVFYDQLTSPAARQAAAREFDAVRAIGVQGFPTTILRNGNSLKMLAAGYRPVAGIRPFLRLWLEQA